jgi:hypothetical protein
VQRQKGDIFASAAAIRAFLRALRDDAAYARLRGSGRPLLIIIQRDAVHSPQRRATIRYFHADAIFTRDVC